MRHYPASDDPVDPVEHFPTKDVHEVVKLFPSLVFLKFKLKNPK